MKRAAIVVLVLVAACGGDSEQAATTTTVAPTTTTTLSPAEASEAEFAADKKLIVALWRGQSDAFGNGDTPEAIEAGFQYTADTTYPGTSITAESCAAAAFGGLPQKSFDDEIIVDQSTIERDDGWKVPGGELDGVVPEGRTYIMSLHYETTVNGQVFAGDSESHATILDGKAYQFPNCV